MNKDRIDCAGIIELSDTGIVLLKQMPAFPKAISFFDLNKEGDRYVGTFYVIDFKKIKGKGREAKDLFYFLKKQQERSVLDALAVFKGECSLEN